MNRDYNSILRPSFDGISQLFQTSLPEVSLLGDFAGGIADRVCIVGKAGTSCVINKGFAYAGVDGSVCSHSKGSVLVIAAPHCDPPFVYGVVGVGGIKPRVYYSSSLGEFCDLPRVYCNPGYRSGGLEIKKYLASNTANVSFLGKSLFTGSISKCEEQYCAIHSSLYGDGRLDTDYIHNGVSISKNVPIFGRKLAIKPPSSSKQPISSDRDVGIAVSMTPTSDFLCGRLVCRIGETRTSVCDTVRPGESLVYEG